MKFQISNLKSSLRASLFLLLAGCSSFHAFRSPINLPRLPRRPARAALDVPFLAQKPGQCGPAALAMITAYYDKPALPDDIAAAVYLPNLRGALTTDLAAHAQRLGFWTRVYRGDIADLRQKISAGTPLILATRFGANNHYLVAIAADNFAGAVTVHTDTRAAVVLTDEELLHHWERAGRWTLLACPPNRANWRLTPDEHNDLGVYLERRGKPIAAAGHYRLAAELAPRAALYPFNLGNVFLKLDLNTEAADAFRRAVTLEPDNADALNNLAVAWTALGANLDEAAAHARRAAELRPAHRAYYLDTLGDIYAKQNKIPEARAAYQQALDATTDRQTKLRETIRAHLDKLAPPR